MNLRTYSPCTERRQRVSMPAIQFGLARTLPLDNMARSRAQSLLAGMRYRDGSTNPDTLTLDQAHDVLRWAGQVPA